jgi:hypothetical protein
MKEEKRVQSEGKRKVSEIRRSNHLRTQYRGSGR